MRRLGREYGQARAPRQWDPLSELIYTVLSQNTSDRNSTRACENLQTAYPTWEAVLAADPEDLAKTIWVGGLARIKAPRIQAILRAIVDKRGSLDLAFLREMPVPEAKAWLRQLPGVGPKTAGCVLLFSLGKPAMVVDTHVYRVAKRLGLLPARCSPDQAHDVLEALVLPEWYLPFHIYLITHGRRVCKAQRPRCAACVLEDGCPGSTLRQAPTQKRGGQ
ncbi:MAG: endonuclease III [Chloroflexi bacterium]|nr:endonuclease III [Chloroflexota bacterium]